MLVGEAREWHVELAEPEVRGNCKALHISTCRATQLVLRGEGDWRGCLGGVGLWHISAFLAMGFVEGLLVEGKALARLNLCVNGIGAEEAGTLAEVLGGCITLAHLNLAGNKIGAE
eukprot:CAMPEP_0181292064 /NCGR_PEP_ID=MMETSP1101-20121128/2304_1 /TAXON_ID=46948 /ORGANISM="Rhodomonas abbreviata, Strain Caron Lab Isolate" /LENGTH=115 /DNA_ID=CAMNT_0023396503 /DNA_START=730 /DNA_END=1074 /DNA_ORIENTATION=-